MRLATTALKPPLNPQVSDAECDVAPLVPLESVWEEDDELECESVSVTEVPSDVPVPVLLDVPLLMVCEPPTEVA